MSATIILLCCIAAARGDYIAGRNAAEQLARTGEGEKALRAYLDLAAGMVTPFQKSDAMMQASLLANRLGRTDEAIEIAQAIPLEPQSKIAQMLILDHHRRWTEALQQFGEDDMAAWPDHVKGEALYRRGLMYFFTKQGDRARQDLQQAIPYITEPNLKGLALNRLGDTWRTLLNDPDQALRSYQQVLDTPRTGYKACEAAMAIAKIRLERNDPSAAWQALQRIDMTHVEFALWRSRMLMSRGQVLSALGKANEAIAEHQSALKIDGLGDADRTQHEQAIASLRSKGQ